MVKVKPVNQIVAGFKLGLSLMPKEALETLAVLSSVVAVQLQGASEKLKLRIYLQLSFEERKLIFEE